MPQKARKGIFLRMLPRLHKAQAEGASRDLVNAHASAEGLVPIAEKAGPAIYRLFTIRP
jgi:hypothetical protein